jgi:hypothetical protein
MIRWKDVGTEYTNAQRARWRRRVCEWELRVDGNAEGTCMGVSRGDDDEPHNICKACDRLIGGDAE